MNTTLKVLEDARERYAAHPDHTPLGQDSNHCVVVVLDWAAIHSHNSACAYDREAEQALARAADIDEPDLRIALIKWNAAASTEEVLAAFDRAIAEQKAMA